MRALGSWTVHPMRTGTSRRWRARWSAARSWARTRRIQEWLARTLQYKRRELPVATPKKFVADAIILAAHFRRVGGSMATDHFGCGIGLCASRR